MMAGADAEVHVTWAGEHRFDAGRPDGPTLRLDASGTTGQSPVDVVLSALAACVAVDVVDILQKRRTPTRALAVEVRGRRADTTPRRLTHISLIFTIAGEGLDSANVERAIDLAITKYCSVRESLREDIPIEWTFTLEP